MSAGTGRRGGPSAPVDEADALELALRDWLSYHGGSRFQPNHQERALHRAARAAIARLRRAPE